MFSANPSISPTGLKPLDVAKRRRNVVGWRGSDGGVKRATVEWTRGWSAISLVCPYFEVNFLAFSTKWHCSVNVSLGGLKGQGKI